MQAEALRGKMPKSSCGLLWQEIAPGRFYLLQRLELCVTTEAGWLSLQSDAGARAPVRSHADRVYLNPEGPCPLGCRGRGCPSVPGLQGKGDVEARK